MIQATQERLEVIEINGLLNFRLREPTVIPPLTPYKTRVWIEGRLDGITDQYKLAAWQAWHMAAFSRTKKLPDLEKLMRKIGGEKPKQQSPKQMLKMAEMITGMMDGEDKRVKK
ncbi:unnamed protein product [marine sediment metagenome]|uniref:Uncharacterized protein n=1 Tax=marine sediment metagenome TaxID=412755 RepID=X1CGT9_9ZZZZ